MNRQQLAEAFARKSSGRCHNADSDGTVYTLHSSPIAKWVGDTVQFYWHGWYTTTTAAHMNAILRALGANFRISYSQARDTRQTHFVWEPRS